MRKYHQAALAIIATISLVALLLYRNEYNKLRYVLEVLNYFGTPADMQLYRRNCSSLCSSNGDKSNSTLSDYAMNDWLDDPITSWQRLTDEIYVYSAYTTGDGEIIAIAFAKSKRLSSLSCKVVYENDFEPLNGEFTYKTIDSSENVERKAEGSASKGIYRGYRFICRYDRIEEKAIAGVTFQYKDAKYKSSVETILSVRKLDKRRNEVGDKIGVCVAPSSSRPITNTDIINFISFHNSIGLERFVVYDFGIPQRINNIMKHIGRQSGTEFNLDYATIPWNFPFTEGLVDVAIRIAEVDCLYRLYNKVRFVTTLTWDEFVIVKYHRTVEKLFRDIDETGLVGHRYGLTTRNVCVDYSKSMPLRDGRIVANRPVYIYRSMNNISALNYDNMASREITPDIIVLNKYTRHCNQSDDLELNNLDGRRVGKFSTAIESSPIYKLLHMYI